jgi:hypothetical protein
LSVTLSRRDLFDARFQLLAQADEDKAEEKDELRFVDAPSDLVRGVYEGGLKTWECSVDLAGYLLDRPELLSGDGTTQILEVIWLNREDAQITEPCDRSGVRPPYPQLHCYIPSCRRRQPTARSSCTSRTTTALSWSS